MSQRNDGFFRILAQSLIGLFFFWHAAAIGVFAIPINTEHVIAKPARAWLVQHVFSPYVLLTSQWQQWNLFSPDPLRRVTRYRIEQQTPEGGWKVLEALVPGTYEWWRHATHFKMHIGMLEKDQDTYRTAVVRHFLMMRCASHHLPAETPIRITYLHYVVPRPASLLEAMHPGPWPANTVVISTDPEYCP